MLFPRRCPVCDRVLPFLPSVHQPRICPECLPELSYIREPYCMKCGKPLQSDSLEFCPDCAEKKHAFRAGRAVFLYRGRIKEALYRFKYAARREYARFFAEETLRRRRKWLASIRPDVIIPVPMYAAKKRKRGYNQAEDFAKALGRMTGIPVRTDLVYRIRDTVPMKGLSRPERRENMRHAFSVNTPRLAAAKPKHILIVDDIYTTGSTIDAIAKALMHECEAEIYFLCISIGQGP